MIEKTRFWIEQSIAPTTRLRFPVLSGRALPGREREAFSVTIRHGDLLRLVEQHAPHYLRTMSWTRRGLYHTECPNADLRAALRRFEE